MKALIIENSRLYRQLLDDILGRHGFSIDSTDQLSHALEYINETTYDIICLNENLKDGSGLDLVRACRSNPVNRNAPILFFTADAEFEAHHKDIPVDIIIHKKNIQQISDQIVRYLDRSLDPVLNEGRILLIEDSPSIARLILTTLQTSGYDVNFFDSADVGWQEFRNEVSYGSDLNAYDLIITDIIVEGDIDGLQFTRLVRQLDDARGFIPIMAITARNDAELRLSLFKAGINDFIQKPILPDELLARVNNLISNKRLLDKVHDQRRELFALATTDKLTGCHNRHSMMEFSHKLIANAIRHQFPVCMLVIDLDNFKSINDNHGHIAGDKVLQAIGQLLSGFFRDGDMVARFGGEEFVILLDHCDIRDAELKAEKLRQAIMQLKPEGLPVTASIGISTIPEDKTGNFDTLFQSADSGVYLAKELGRNQIRVVASK